MSKQKDLSRLVDSVTILGSPVTVEYHEELYHEDGEECLGLCYVDERVIKIQSIDKLPYESQLSTLLHECIEFMVHRLELDVEHRDISSMETAMFSMLRENPELCKAFSLYRPKE